MTVSEDGRLVTLLAEVRRHRADHARQVGDVLRHQVLAGAYPDRVLPSERTLCREFNASRNTVREALVLLRDEGLVDRVPGIGTTVASGKYPHGLHRLLGLAEVMHPHGEITNEVRAVTVIPSPAPVAARLGLGAGEPVVYIERLRRIGGEPLSLDLTYLARDIGEPLLAEDLSHRDIFVLIEHTTGRPLGHADVSLEAVNADRRSARLLGTADNAALLMVERLAHLADGRPVDLESIRFRGDRLTMQGRLDRAPTELPRWAERAPTEAPRRAERAPTEPPRRSGTGC
jgi:GntR family transcriptional regulator